MHTAQTGFAAPPSPFLTVTPIRLLRTLWRLARQQRTPHGLRTIPAHVLKDIGLAQADLMTVNCE